MTSHNDQSDSSDTSEEFDKILPFVAGSFKNMRLLVRKHQEQCNAGSSRRRRRTIHRDRRDADNRLFNDYFGENPVYNDDHFRRRFQMRRTLFLRIVEALSNHSEYFRLRYDAVGRRGLSPLTKCTAAMRMLTYGTSADILDEYLRIGETTTLESLKKICEGIVVVFGEEYLRRPNEADVARLLAIGKQRGFPGMLGSLDCKHWEWKNRPTAWHGYFRQAGKKPTLILEAVASADTWIWHAFFGMPGSANDINVIERSPLFKEVYEGTAPKCEYMVNNNKYDMGYYLTDGIYPKWATFVKTISLPQDPKAKLFAQHQEANRKDVERACGVLQSRFAIVRFPGRYFTRKVMGSIMRACIILHNMIVEDERDGYLNHYDYEYVADEVPISPLQHEHFDEYTAYLMRVVKVQDNTRHGKLKEDLVEEIWKCHGQKNHN